MITTAATQQQLLTAGEQLEDLRPWVGVWPVNTESRAAAEALAELLSIPALLEPAAGCLALSLCYDHEERLALWDAYPDEMAAAPWPMTHVCLFRLPADPPLPIAATLASRT